MKRESILVVKHTTGGLNDILSTADRFLTIMPCMWSKGSTVNYFDAQVARRVEDDANALAFGCINSGRLWARNDV